MEKENTEQEPTFTETDTVIISDVHLGSDVSRADVVLAILKTMRFKRLILLGDMFDDLNFKRLKRRQWKLLSHVRKLSKPGRGVEVVWIKGNHDEQVFELVSCMLGVEGYNDYEFQFQGKRCLARHGHQFDKFLSDNPVISKIAATIYLMVQKYDTPTFRFSRSLKRWSKGWLRNSHRVANRALNHAAHHGFDMIFCGHTHQTLEAHRDGVSYYNTGCWTDIPCSMVTMDETHGIRRLTILGDASDYQVTPAEGNVFDFDKKQEPGLLPNPGEATEPQFIT
jgi:UDP-2,3-diacylglucosamine pyrophosphatase LpxH